MLTRVIGALVAFGFLMTASVALADAPKAPNVSSAKAKATPADVAVDEVGLALDLIAFGRATKSPEALLMAARILASVGPQTKVREKKVEVTEQVAPDPGANDKDPAPKPEDLLAEAKTLAKGDKEMLAKLDKEKLPKSRGVLGGPWVHRDVIAALTQDVYGVVFEGGLQARIRVRGDGDTDLDCLVYDEFGNLVAQDTDSTDLCLLVFQPRWTGPFVLRIVNQGRVYNRYVIVTN